MLSKIRDWWLDQRRWPDRWDYQTICADEDKRASGIGFVIFKLKGFIWYFTKHQIDRLLCKVFGHRLADRSVATPDSGNMDVECKRCGEYWSNPLY